MITSDRLGKFGTLINDLMSNDDLMGRFNDDPHSVMAERGLSEQQRRVLLDVCTASAVDAEVAKEIPDIEPDDAGFLYGPGHVRVAGYVRMPPFVRTSGFSERLRPGNS